jgi:hypothetical protein
MKILLVLFVLGAPFAATAQPIAPDASLAAPPAAVEEFTVTPVAKCIQPKANPAAPWPKVLSTFPADGAVVRPGLLVLRVTFDVPMSCRGFFTTRPPFQAPCPDVHQHWVVSFDRRTIRAICHVDAGGHYGVRMSDQPDSRFYSLQGKPLDIYEFSFNVSDGGLIQTVGESLDQDPLVNPPPPEFAPMPLNDMHFDKHSPPK